MSLVCSSSLTPSSSRTRRQLHAPPSCTLQLAGPALREQGPRQIFQNHLCLGTGLRFPITAPWRCPVPPSPVLDQDSVPLRGDTEHRFLRSAPSAAFRSHSSWPLLQSCWDQKHFEVTAHGLCFSLAGTRHHVHYLFSCLYGLIKQGAKSCSLLLFTSCFEFFFFLPFLFSFTLFPLLLMSAQYFFSFLLLFPLFTASLPEPIPISSINVWALGFVFW